MKYLNAFREPWESWLISTGREQQIKDYVVLLNQVVWQRQASFFAAALLAAFYFDPIMTFASYSVVVLTEMLDLMLGRKSKAWDGQDPVVGQQILKRIAINTVLSACAISVFIVSIAVQQTSGGHFTPLFFLFSAALFAAMYNSQMMGILLLRLAIYGCAFLFIAFLDVVRYSPALSSPIWQEFFTIIFVLYFLADMSVKFYRNYQDRLSQMTLIKEENEQTKAALEIKSQFLSTVSHELRTPLTSIIGGLDLVNNGVFGEVPETLKPVISIAAKNGHRLGKLIDDLLDLQKIEAGEIVFHLKQLDANGLVKEAVESTTGYADKLGIQVTILPCRDDCQILGDRSRLIQVMNNLLANALKFSGPGGTVKVGVETFDTRVRISVQDEGVGIPAGAKDRVFGKFSQVDSSDVRKVGGTGLGLNISKQIVERHSGTIDYTSELGVGSTFCIEFDRVTDKDGASVSPEPAAELASWNRVAQAT
ncbi:MAG: HAMP domain-containing sensor histidine kinase [Pseudotabrizicola sp.]|uniref:sensor histidine kinase n=1 Tax=Pseudotabrizicola sp. TaxID=2939647 RepID=UPI00271AE352|nr:HAMP domain-containing sensor histidine kinase [Pseudotabrizicola sp.]MDO9638452.1 HAMP domain-containing sensor histidine kinase [Pseudotabrizicola sp.]